MLINRLVQVDVEAGRAAVESGIVLDQLNRQLSRSGLMFPVDVSTAGQATLGGMAGNNSCGARSIRYGTMRDNVQAIDAILVDGSRKNFGPVSHLDCSDPMFDMLLEVGRNEAGEISRRFPELQRRVGGYNIDALLAGESTSDPNLAHLLVGSEGTLAVSELIHLKLQPIPPHRVLGICHFPTFYAAMEATQHLVKLKPSAVELIDRTMLDLSQDISIFRKTVKRYVTGKPEALLLVEFAGNGFDQQRGKLKQLEQCMQDLGFPNAVITAVEPDAQKAIWAVRTAGLNIMMSMKGDGKPVSFIEDCAVRLEDLAEYTERLTNVFKKHGTNGTWYAHASVGCLHVRPVLNLKLETDVKKMRAIAEEAFAMVREYKGSHSGEHGDGLVRSEFHEDMFGSRMVENFARVKQLFDPQGLMNPGKIVRPPKMDDRKLFRYKPGYQAFQLKTALDWSEWGGLAQAVEMCNNNGACRKLDASVMCPSYRATLDEQHVTRGRANTLRLALSGQLDNDSFTSRDMYDTMQLCISCKGCKRECPTGVDMAKMKVEFLYHYRRRHGLSVRDRMIAYLPRYARTAASMAAFFNARNHSSLLATLGERAFGLSAKRSLPNWHPKPFTEVQRSVGGGTVGEVVLFADTFNRYFEPENLGAACDALEAAGYRIHFPVPSVGNRPLCCGRTFLAAGLVDEARAEARRTLSALQPFLDRGLTVVGLEPSCLLTFRDEFKSLFPAKELGLLPSKAKLFTEFISEEKRSGRLDLPVATQSQRRVAIHGHCHQKAFDVLGATVDVLDSIPGIETQTITAGCCGMAGAFGYQAETYDVSVKMAELDLLPAIRALDADTYIAADGTSCRHQINDLTGRRACHTVQILSEALSK